MTNLYNRNIMRPPLRSRTPLTILFTLLSMTGNLSGQRPEGPEVMTGERVALSVALVSPSDFTYGPETPAVLHIDEARSPQVLVLIRENRLTPRVLSDAALAVHHLDIPSVLGERSTAVIRLDVHSSPAGPVFRWAPEMVRLIRDRARMGPIQIEGMPPQRGMTMVVPVGPGL